jgi:hypothetical protein
MSDKKDEKWRKAGMKVINDHSGKKKVYENYMKVNPRIAEEYVKFVSKHPDAVYISWDNIKQKFVA